jgi:hypothetical protein
MFRTVAGFTGGLVANAITGQPTPVGLIVHGVVFVVLRRLLSRTVSSFGGNLEQANARRSQVQAEARDMARQQAEAKMQKIYGGAKPAPVNTPKSGGNSPESVAEARRIRRAMKAAH